MKKLLLAISVCIYGFCFSQGGTFYIYNQSPYGVIYDLASTSSTVGNCYPSISGTNYTSPDPGSVVASLLMPNSEVAYPNYKDSFLMTPPIKSWQGYTGDPTIDPQILNLPPGANSSLFDYYMTTTNWRMCKFDLRDPDTGKLYGGYSIGESCYGDIISYVTDTGAYPMQATFFKINNDAYLIIE